MSQAGQAGASAVNGVNTQAFWAIPSNDVTNVTGDGTGYNPFINAQVQQQTGSGFNSTTGIFTAPVTGYFLFTYQFNLSNLDAAHSQLFLVNAGTGYGYYGSNINPGAVRIVAGGSYTSNQAFAFRMTAGETLELILGVDGSTKTVGVSIQGSLFSGCLLA